MDSPTQQHRSEVASNTSPNNETSLETAEPRTPRQSIFGPQLLDAGHPVIQKRHTPPMAIMSPQATKGPISETPGPHKTPNGKRGLESESQKSTASESEDDPTGLVTGTGVTAGDSQRVFAESKVAKASEMYKRKSGSGSKKSDDANDSPLEEEKVELQPRSDEDDDAAMREATAALSHSPILSTRDVANKAARMSVENGRNIKKRENEAAMETPTKPNKRPKSSQEVVEEEEISDLDDIPVKERQGKKSPAVEPKSDSPKSVNPSFREKSSSTKEGESRRDSLVTSNDKHRALGSEKHTETILAEGPLKVLLSSSTLVDDRDSMEWLERNGVQVIEELPNRRANFVCVIGKELKRTAKVLRSLALGKLVLTDNWITESVKKGKLLDQKKFIHTDLVADIYRDRSALFAEQTLFFTNGLKLKYGKGWSDIQHLARDLGAKDAEYGGAKKGSGIKGGVICFGVDSEDKEAIDLVQKYEMTVYHRDMLTQSVLDGDFDLESDQHQLVQRKKKSPRKNLKSKAGKRKS